MRRQALFWLAAAGIASALVRGINAQTAGGSYCRSFDLQPRPAWLAFGEWVNDGTELILPDAFDGRLLRYKRTGEQLRPLSTPSLSATFSRPASIDNSGRGLVVLDLPDERLVALKANLQLAWQARLRDVPFPDDERIELFLSFISAGDGFIGLTVLVNEKTQEKWWGIARVRLGDSPQVERVHTLPSMMSEEGSFYFSHQGPYLAKANGAVYALFFGERPHIERLLPSPGKLAAFPAGYTSPVLGFNTRENTESAFRAWENSTAPVALFGRGRFLYLLARRPRADQGTEWILFQIDPKRDKMIRSIALPTRAKHVLVIPGPREWAIVEKGGVVAVGGGFEQTVGAALFIRSSMIEDPTARTDLSKCTASRK